MKKGIIALTVSFLAVSAAAQQPVSADRFADAVNHWNKEHGAQTYERYKPDRFREIADNIVAYQNADGGWPKNLDMLAADSTASTTSGEGFLIRMSSIVMSALSPADSAGSS